MNSKQGIRYIKNRLGNDLKEKILEYNGIISENISKKKSSIIDCPRCQLVNKEYCTRNGIKTIESEQSFSREMSQHGFLAKQIRINNEEREYHWLGIRLKKSIYS